MSSNQQLILNYFEKDDLFRRFLKIVDIAIFSAMYTTLGILLAWGMNKLNGPVNHAAESAKTNLELFINIASDGAVVACAFYLIRQIFQQIVMPWEGVHGYTLKKTKEAYSAAIVLTVFYRFYILNSVRMEILKKRLAS